MDEVFPFTMASKFYFLLPTYLFFTHMLHACPTKVKVLLCYYLLHCCCITNDLDLRRKSVKKRKGEGRFVHGKIYVAVHTHFIPEHNKKHEEIKQREKKLLLQQVKRGWKHQSSRRDESVFFTGTSGIYVLRVYLLTSFWLHFHMCAHLFFYLYLYKDCW